MAGCSGGQELDASFPGSPASTEVEPSSTVTFQVHKPQETTGRAAPVSSAPASPSPEATPTEETEKTTSTGLRGSSALATIDEYGRYQFRYGVKAHWVLGKLAQRIETDRWFLKVEADVTKPMRTTQRLRVNVECSAGGTDEAPLVESFISY